MSLFEHASNATLMLVETGEVGDERAYEQRHARPFSSRQMPPISAEGDEKPSIICMSSLGSRAWIRYC